MTTLQGIYSGFSVADLDQIKTYTEGGPDISLDPIVLTTYDNYSNVYTLTMTINSPNAANVSIIQTDSSGPLLSRTGNTYTITSQYTNPQGISLNNWAYFKLALRGLQIHFNNSDWGETFDISCTFTDGVTINNSTIQIITTPQADVSGANQTKTGLPMAFNVRTLQDMGLSPIQIIDPAAASKTYRITLTVNDVTNSSGTSDGYIWLYDTANSISQSFQKSVTLSGTASYINSVLNGTLVPSYALGLGFASFDPRFYGNFTVSYKQEVLTTTEVGVTVPYVQEVGTLTFGINYSSPFTIATGITYVEDTNTSVFSVGTLTDQAGQQWPSETSSTGMNNYTLDIQAMGTFPGSNPIVVTYSGDSGVNDNVNVNGNYSYLISSTSPNKNIYVIPPADWTADISLRVRLTRGNSHGSTDQIYEGYITIPCTSTHNEYSIIGGAAFSIGTNALNLGSITDTATGKNYTVTIDMKQNSATYGVLADTTGTGTWNGTGGAYGFGRLTISGTKSVVNASLAALTYTTGSGSALSDVISLEYKQNQTTNSILQGTSTINLSNAFIWGSGNSVSGFVFDEDTKMTYNLGSILATISGTAKAQITLGTAFSTMNGGSITGWTKISDTVWEFTGTKASVNAALAATEFVPPADRIGSFTVNMSVYDGATLLYNSATYSTIKTFTVRTTHNENSLVSSIQLLTGGNSATFNIGSITDLRPDNISSSITYSFTLTPASLTEVTSMSSSGTGGTSVWSLGKLTITGTKTQVNSHLATITVNYTGNNNSSISCAQIQTTNNQDQGIYTITTLKPVPQFLAASTTSTSRSTDFTIWDNDTVSQSNRYTFGNSLWTSLNSPGPSTIVQNSSTASSWSTLSSTSITGTSGGLTVGSGITKQEDTLMYAGGKRAFLTGSNALSLVYSSDDLAWTVSSPIVTKTFRNWHVFSQYLGGNFIVMVSGSDGGFDYLETYNSTTGTSWTAGVVPLPYNNPAYFNNQIAYANSKFVFQYSIYNTAYSNSRTSVVYSTSPNAWTTVNLATNMMYLPTASPVWNGSYWTVMNTRITDNHVFAWKSTNLTTWTSADTGIIQSGDYGNNDPDLTKAVTLGGTVIYRSKTNIYYSTDSVTWTASTLGFSPYKVNALKVIGSTAYALVDTTANNSKLMSSTDGINWTSVYTFPSGSSYTQMFMSS